MAENRDFIAESNQLRAEADKIRKTLVSKTTPNGLLEEIAREMRMMRREIKEMKEENKQKLEELKKNQQLQDEKMDKISNELAKCVPKIIPIRFAILGEWKMVAHENFEGYEEEFGRSFEDFSRNMKYEMENGKLREIEADFNDLVEGEGDDGKKDLYEEDNHLKSFLDEDETMDRYIEDGKLYVFENYCGTVWQRVYVKI